MQAPPRDAAIANLSCELQRAFARHRHGWHRLLVAPSPRDAERMVLALARDLAAQAYTIRLGAWLSDEAGAGDVLRPYRHLSRSSAGPTLALVCDTPVLFEPDRAAWRRDPFGSRTMRRSLISSSLPTFWWIPRSGAAGFELAAVAPECVCDVSETASEIRTHDDGEFIVRALTAD